MPVARLTKAELTYDEAGRGDRAVLFIHGHPFDRSMWRPQLHAAAQAGWRAIAPDLRGYGDSSLSSGKILLETFAADLAELLDLLGCERAVVVGLSMGGQIAMELCRTCPERVSGLLLAATFARTESEEGKLLRYRIAERIESEGMNSYAHELLPKMLAPGTIASMPELALSVLEMMLRAPALGAAAALRGRAERPSYSEALQRMHVPAQIVVGDEDCFTSREDADELCRLLPRSELLWQPGIGHMPNLESTPAFNQALLGLLDRVEEHQRKALA